MTASEMNIVGTSRRKPCSRQVVEQARVLAVVEVPADPRRQPHVGLHFVAVALVHDALRLDRVGQVDLEEAEPLALVPDRPRVEPRAEDDDLAVLAAGARRRRQEGVAALVEEDGARRHPLEEVGDAVEEPRRHHAARRLRQQLERDVVRQLAVLREHGARPQHLQVLRAVLHRLVVEAVQLGENHLRQRVEPVRHPLERAALAERPLRRGPGRSSSIAAAASGSTSSLRAARGGGARPCPSEGAADGRCSPRGPHKRATSSGIGSTIAIEDAIRPCALRN